MNKKGVVKIIVVLIILVIIFLFAAFYFINKQKDIIEHQQMPEQTAQQEHAVNNIENSQAPAQEQTPATMPTRGITGELGEGSGATASMPLGGSSGGGGGSGGGGEDNSGGGEEEPEDNETNPELPPECIYERNSKLPQCVID